MQATAHRVMCKGSGDGVALLPWRCAHCLHQNRILLIKHLKESLEQWGGRMSHWLVGISAF